MKYNYLYIIIVLIIEVWCWRRKIINFIKYWKNSFHLFKYKRHTMMNKNHYTFRPFEMTKIDFKSYRDRSFGGHGINLYPKARSGHRIVVNDTDIFCFGGKSHR